VRTGGLRYGACGAGASKGERRVRKRPAETGRREITTALRADFTIVKRSSESRNAVLNQRAATTSGGWLSVRSGDGFPARVSTVEQTVRLQTDALTAAGCLRGFTDVASGAKSDRPQLMLLLDQLRPGDSLVVSRLDRLGRSLRHLIDTLTGLDARGVGSAG
jgi:hypothetical protein